MREENKNRFSYGLKITALIIGAMLTIITCSGLWGAAETADVKGFFIGASILLIIFNAVVIWLCAKAAHAKYIAKIHEFIQEQFRQK